ncbi:MAG TPA: hypothetical protein VEK75_07185 [Xanthobacteraceae bacterium]|nr:hypothetical protein [Xanthobacteraceae bacterium]
MRRAILVLAVITFGAAVNGMAAAQAAGNIRLAQTSAVTTCMMTCNAQAANCQAICLVPGTPPTNAATTTGNANVSTSCQLSCSTQQLACQTTCARSSPSP